MARVDKAGIGYFSHDVDMLQDVKVKFLKAKHGLVGYAIYLRLLEDIYRDSGYFMQVDDDFHILFCDDNSIDRATYDSVIETCVAKGLFNESIYTEFAVFTSKRIQENYCSATNRRKEVVFIEKYLLTDVSKHYTKRTNVSILTENVDINSENADGGTQSKVNKSKVNKSKVNNIYIGDSENESPVDESESQNESSDDDKIVETDEDFFNKAWDFYPEKKGKGSIKDSHKKVIHKLGDEFMRCIKRYKLDIDLERKNGFPTRSYMHGSRFFKTGYVDYLDKVYSPPSRAAPADKPKQGKQNGFNNFGQYNDPENIELEQKLGIRKDVPHGN